MTTTFSNATDKRQIYMLLGCYCNKPELAIRYETSAVDYPESFHKAIFGAIHNIALKGTSTKITSIDIENELSVFKTALDLWTVNRGSEYIDSAIEDTENMICNTEMYWDNVRKYSIIRNSRDNLKLDVSFIYEEYDELNTLDVKLKDKKEKMEKFNKMKSLDVLREISDRFTNFHDSYKSAFTSNYSFHIGDNVSDLIESYKNQNNTYGYPYQNMIFNKAFRGKKPKKYVIVSRPTGAGKSRMQLANACDLSVDKIYDWEKKSWVDMGEKVPVLYITSELTEDEVDSILLAHISGIPEDKIVDWEHLTEDEINIIYESEIIMKESKLYCEYTEEFSINILEDMVRKYVITLGIYGVFFDYISENNGLYAESYAKTGARLQTHQILLSLSNALKLMCNKYGLYFESSTQMNDNFKQEGNLDASSVRGSKAIIDKADIAMIGLRITPKDLKKIDPILRSGFYKTPNYIYSCYKNRGGKLVNFLCFTLTDLGTSREEGLFITDGDYALLKVEKLDLGFNISVPVGNGEIYKVDEDEVSAVEYIDEFNKIKV